MENLQVNDEAPKIITNQEEAKIEQTMNFFESSSDILKLGNAVIPEIANYISNVSNSSSKRRLSDLDKEKEVLTTSLTEDLITICEYINKVIAEEPNYIFNPEEISLFVPLIKFLKDENLIEKGSIKSTNLTPRASCVLDVPQFWITYIFYTIATSKEKLIFNDLKELFDLAFEYVRFDSSLLNPLYVWATQKVRRESIEDRDEPNLTIEENNNTDIKREESTLLTDMLTVDHPAEFRVKSSKKSKSSAKKESTRKSSASKAQSRSRVMTIKMSTNRDAQNKEEKVEVSAFDGSNEGASSKRNSYNRIKNIDLISPGEAKYKAKQIKRNNEDLTVDYNSFGILKEEQAEEVKRRKRSPSPERNAQYDDEENNKENERGRDKNKKMKNKKHYQSDKKDRSPSSESSISMASEMSDNEYLGKNKNSSISRKDKNRNQNKSKDNRSRDKNRGKSYPRKSQSPSAKESEEDYKTKGKSKYSRAASKTNRNKSKNSSRHRK